MFSKSAKSKLRKLSKRAPPSPKGPFAHKSKGPRKSWPRGGKRS